ncbi:MAG TPA: hypothetical protein PK431_04795 [Chitinophagales bacterium]|nr:hypothetical protein [Chitinophagales bacterium]
MKANRLFFILMTSMIVFATSCNKTYYCECLMGGVTVARVPIKSLGKGGAKNVCKSYEEQNNRNILHNDPNGTTQNCSIQ